ncbi:PEP/pyruvate-binding domain-containing protein [Desulfosporosinus sp. OT]|uniref:PEP/pyruvate-binding domain-containing protein n=1 Tax=Desulfosporosinus sp. OT TaxID=913865 RepID=UPI000223B2F4|nr:PEP/pyruvate-binding domain-containing protein [Desulfosporosinus sp. OT]EGW36065.1 PEP-utilizing enzyme, mobile domain protein [Desulfosporosinus sp. OT]
MEIKEGCFFSWPEAFLADTEKVGGKGWNLARLDRYGFAIPRGGVLSADVYKYFLEENGLKIMVEEIQSVTLTHVNEEKVSAQITVLRERINSGFVPGYIQEQLFDGLKNIGISEIPLAVRSSATAEDSARASFAGVHDSFLNVRGPEYLLSTIKGCFASLWTIRAVAYRRKMNFKDDEVQAAVVIMEMVEAKAAGVGFTCEPLTGRQDVLLINANFGLGESVVSGRVESDEYLVDLSPALPRVIDKRIGTKKGQVVVKESGGTEFIHSDKFVDNQVLSDAQITQLGLLMLRVYEALGQGEQHQDVEWVFDGKGFVIVQARPVTVLPRYTYREIKDQPDIWSSSGLRDSNAMVQSTLNWRIAELHLNTNSFELFRYTGYPLLPGVQYVRLFGGRVYVNITVIQWVDYVSAGLDPADYESMFGYPVVIQIKDKGPYRGIAGMKRLRGLIKLQFKLLSIWRNDQQFYVRVNSLTESWRGSGFRDVQDLECIDLYNNLAGLMKEASVVFIAMMTAAIYPLMVLTKALHKYFPSKENGIINGLMAGRALITSAEHGYRLMELAELAGHDQDARRFLSSEADYLAWEKELKDNSPFKQAFRTFLTEYGHRGTDELDIINPRWGENPCYLLQMIRNSMKTADVSGLKARQQEIYLHAWQEVQQKVPAYRRPHMKYWLKRATKGAEMREMSKSILVKVFGSFRMLALELGRRFEERGIIQQQNDIFHCAWSEIFSILRKEWDGKGLAVLVAERKYRRRKSEEISLPVLIVGEVPKPVEQVKLSKGSSLTGFGVASGRAVGRARLIYHPHKGESLEFGDVLVAPSTDPAWTPLFLRASAVVMETGGVISHGAIVAREYGIPAVVNVLGVMKSISEGQMIEVDGDEGKIELL